ncbi:PDZ domain-containing protein [Paenibacillus daejeonensis]|uniref:PDZ domain-containing protein n=1 Tax=Paenibacillus daejeonensis TaxID=135193 RepID=UPI000374CE07|nr:PDZ domain-containing protein [Paenibacillus daejeonensis]
MAYWQRMYLIGMVLAIMLCIIGELIWIPDPIHIGSSLYWIDLLNGMVYLLAVVPLVWLVAAVGGIVHARKEALRAGLEGRNEARRKRGYSVGLYLDVLRRGLLVLTSLVAAVFISWMAATGEMQLMLMVAIAGLLLASWLIALWDLLVLERRRRGGKFPKRSVVAFVVSVALLFALFYPMPYMVTYPGLSVNMHRYAVAEGDQGRDGRGQIMGVLVFDRPAFPIDWLYAELFPNYKFREIRKLGMSIGSYENLVHNLKMEANDLGSAVGFKLAGVGDGAVAYGAQVQSVQIGGPAYGELRPGDIIIRINTHAVSSSLTLTNVMRLIEPGDPIEVRLLRNNEPMTVRLNTVVHPEDENRPAVGITVDDALMLDLPMDVRFRSYFAHEGGPSHGAALALTLIDQLTPGGVTFGNRVAVTGTINANGTVGKIGGIRQKAYTVYRNGADVFFVPYGQAQEARLGAPELNIVPVQTLREILDWLKANPR